MWPKHGFDINSIVLRWDLNSQPFDHEIYRQNFNPRDFSILFYKWALNCPQLTKVPPVSLMFQFLGSLLEPCFLNTAYCRSLRYETMVLASRRGTLSYAFISKFTEILLIIHEMNTLKLLNIWFENILPKSLMMCYVNRHLHKLFKTRERSLSDKCHNQFSRSRNMGPFQNS